MRQLIKRIVGGTEPVAGPAVAGMRPEKQADYPKEFVGRSVFAGRAGADEDFSGETGAERRWQHRSCCAAD